MNFRPRLDQRQVQRNFHRQAQEYERHARVQERVAAQLVQLLAGCPRLPGRILEVGCGTGLLSQHLVPLGGEGLLLSDLAPGMTRRAVRRLPGVMAVDADARALPLAAASCSLLVSSSVYQWVDDLPAAFTEAWRVLRPGGLLAIALFGARTLFELRSAHGRAVADLGNGRRSHALDFPSLAQVCRAAQGAGFLLEQAVTRDEVEFHDSVEALLRGLKRIGAGNASTARPPGLASRRIMQAMMKGYRQQFATAKGLPATYEVLYLAARKT